MLPAAITCQGLSKSYGSRRAVHALDLEVEPGTVLGLLGPNGAGKTTLIRMLTTILTPDTGSFAIAGVGHDRPAEIRRRIGVLPESAGCPDGQTGEQVLAFHARLFGQSRAQARATAYRLLEQVGLLDRAGSLVAGYSRGMRQRLGIARAMVNEPDVLFLDEPTLGLDPAGQHQVLKLVTGIARERGATVVLSTHLLAEVEQVCDRVVIFNMGRVVADGDIDEVALMVAAPRQGRLRLTAGTVDAGIRVLSTAADVTSVRRAGMNGDLLVDLREGITPQEAAPRLLRALLAGEADVLGFEFERGRLSDAFLRVTAQP